MLIAMDNLLTSLKNLTKNCNTLLDVPLQFDGEYGGKNVLHFISFIGTYKRIKCISDEQALQELGYLLKDHAYNWWQKHKCQLVTWSEAITALQNKFSVQRPAHVVYQQILNKKFEEYSSSSDFIYDKYELFNELPHPKPTDRHQVDLVYAMLPPKYNERIKCFKIRSLLHLRDVLEKDDIRTEQFKARGKQMEPNVKVEQNGNCSALTAKRKSTDCPQDNNQKREPVIKVRRTEELMPPQQVKEEDVEFISVISSDTQQGSSKNIYEMSNFQIDPELMNQINNIIDESEQHQQQQTILPFLSSMSQNGVPRPLKQPAENTQPKISALSDKCGSFGNCPERFNGEENSFKVDEFISAIIKYKLVENISDEKAVTEIAMLFEGKAAQWWRCLKDKPISFDDVIKKLRETFSVPKPTWSIYAKINENRQQRGETTVSFINKKRKLFGELKNCPSETEQIDILYGLLHFRIRELVPRCKLTTFEQLFSICREAEIVLKEYSKNIPEEKKRCSFCKNRGHNSEVCKSKANFIKANNMEYVE